MAVTMRTRATLTRRRFLSTAAASAGLTMAGGIAKPAISWAPDRPRITHGIQSGDVSLDSGVVWARVDRPARCWSRLRPRTASKMCGAAYVDALPETDFTAKALLENLPAGQDIFYRIRFQDLSSPAVLGEPMVGRFRTAPDAQRSVSFVWSGDCAGQGWGIDESRGGFRTYATMLRNRPDFFIHWATASMPIIRSRPSRSSPTERCGATSSRKRSRRSPRRSPSIAGTTSTICST